MEQIRIVVAVVLSILVFLIWDSFFVSRAPQQPDQHPAVSEVQTKDYAEEDKRGEEVLIVSGQPSGVSVEEMAAREKPAATFTIDSNLYSARISGSEACFTAFDLKRYKETKDRESPDKHLVPEENKKGTGCVDFVESETSADSSGFFSSEMDPGNIIVADDPRTLAFSRMIKDSVMIEKRYTFYPDSYVVDLEVLLKNGTGKPLTGSLGVSLNHYFSGKESRFVFEGPCAFKDRRLEEVKLDDIEETNKISGGLSWIAIQTRYFMTAVIPEQTDDAAMLLDYSDDGILKAQYRSSPVTVSPQTMTAYRYKIYMGPKDIGTLQAVGGDLDMAINFGWFDIIARPCLWLMNQIYRVFPNYGVSIMVVTLIIKLLFWPLGTKSYKSMGEMKKIQPLMAAIREKHKNDKKRMNEEMMGLYKTYKVNPLGGCLPMIIQIPVFIAFYRMLYQAIELRHASFLLWINDLSSPERLFAFDVAIPFMQPPTGIPVLTIIMGATMFLQQKMQPAPGDPAQAKMMMLMPIFLTVIFINFPSGLVLYFIVNNLFSIFQQHYVTKKNA